NSIHGVSPYAVPRVITETSGENRLVPIGTGEEGRTLGAVHSKLGAGPSRAECPRNHRLGPRARSSSRAPSDSTGKFQEKKGQIEATRAYIKSEINQRGYEGSRHRPPGRALQGQEGSRETARSSFTKSGRKLFWKIQSKSKWWRSDSARQTPEPPKAHCQLA